MNLRQSAAMVNSSAWPQYSGVRKGAWTEEEDNLLRKCIQKYGEGKWHLVPFRAGLNRCRKSCRLRWLNYLRPDIKRGGFSLDEVDLILRLHKLLGNRWSLIAGRIPGRTANDVKNYWNTHLHKKIFTSAAGAYPGQGNWKGKAPNNIIGNTVDVVRPRPWKFLNTSSSSPRTSSATMTAGSTTTATNDDAHKLLQGYTTPLPLMSPPPEQQKDSITTTATLPPPSEETSHDRVQWWDDLFADVAEDKEVNDEGITTCIDQGHISWTDVPTDLDIFDLLS